MYKEFVIILIVIVLIVVGNIITQNNTNYTVEKMSDNLFYLRSETSKEEVNQELLKEKMEQIEDDWKQEYEKMAYYIEHDELEKVENNLKAIESAIAMDEEDEGEIYINQCKFVLKHIKEKYEFNLQNIF